MRLSLVSCPVYLSPATTRTKPIRLHQVWRAVPAEPAEDDGPDRDRAAQFGESRRAGDPSGPEIEQSGALSRITVRPHDPQAGEEIDKSEIVKGYEYERGQFVTFTKEELKALDVESSKIIDLEKFVARRGVDPVYLDSPYYLYPDGAIAADTLRVIGAAMGEEEVVAVGRLTLSRRERAVMIEPRGAGMALFTLRSAEEVRPAQFAATEGEVDGEMVAIARAIIKQRFGDFDPARYRDRYQEALRELIAAKIKGLPVKLQPVSTPTPVVDLMTALKRSLDREAPAPKRSPATAERAPAAAAKRGKAGAERRQAALLLPLSGARKPREEPASRSSDSAPRRRRTARAS